MLHLFSVKNFRSFKDEATLSMVLDGNAPDDNRSFISPAGYRLSKAMAIIGANASGKTSLIQALVFLKWFIKHSFLQQAPQEQIPISPHFSNHKEKSVFTLIFEHRGQLWKYELEASLDRVWQESLSTKRTRAYSYVFKRDWDEESGEYILKKNSFGLPDNTSKEAIHRQNVSLISVAVQFGVPLALELVSSDIFTNLNALGRHPMNMDRVLESAKFYAQNKNYFTKASNLLTQWDLGLSEINLENTQVYENGQKKEIVMPYGGHLVRDNKHDGFITHELNFFAESSGTQGAFVLLSGIVPALETGSIVVIDELESDLHPHMIPEIMNLFFYPETNPHNAQMIFTCHAMEVLSHLHKGQITLVEKNRQCESDAWRLDEMKGVRADDNFYAKYMAGAYGAVPNL